MDNPNSSQDDAHQPSGQQNNFSFTSPTHHVLGNNMNGPYQNQQLRLSLQQQISSQNASILNLVDSQRIDALRQKNEEIARLLSALNQLQESARTLEQRDFLVRFAVQKIELLGQLFSAMNDAGLLNSSNENDTAISSQIVNLEVTSTERTQPSLVCKLCNSHSACMIILPCQHLCACKPCGTNLAACPICNSPKGGLIEARFG